MNEEYDDYDEECGHEEDSEESDEGSVVTQPDFKVTALYGEVNTKNAKDILATFLVFKEPDLDPETGVETYKPFDFYISTPGGNAADMFAIYDLMRLVRQDTEIHTFGLGKVMSAGVLLLAAGTKGERRISKNCRVMIHAANSNYYGTTNSAHNQIKEVRQLEKMLVEALADETNMTRKEIKKIFNKNIDHYLSAEEAVALGIADIVV